MRYIEQPLFFPTGIRPSISYCFFRRSASMKKCRKRHRKRVDRVGIYSPRFCRNRKEGRNKNRNRNLLLFAHPEFSCFQRLECRQQQGIGPPVICRNRKEDKNMNRQSITICPTRIYLFPAPLNAGSSSSSQASSINVLSKHTRCPN